MSQKKPTQKTSALIGGRTMADHAQAILAAMRHVDDCKDIWDNATSITKKKYWEQAYWKAKCDLQELKNAENKWLIDSGVNAAIETVSQKLDEKAINEIIEFSRANREAIKKLLEARDTIRGVAADRLPAVNTPTCAACPHVRYCQLLYNNRAHCPKSRDRYGSIADYGAKPYEWKQVAKEHNKGLPKGYRLLPATFGQGCLRNSCPN